MDYAHAVLAYLEVRSPASSAPFKASSREVGCMVGHDVHM